MRKRITMVSTPVAHLVGPGQLRGANGRLAYVPAGEDEMRLDVGALRAVYCYGPVSVTAEALRLMFEQEVEGAWLSSDGSRCWGRLVRPSPSWTALRILQHRAMADRPTARAWATRAVAARIESLLRAARHYQRHGQEGAGEALDRLQRAAGGVAGSSVEQLRGVEGSAALAWFGLLGLVLREPWRFEGRNRRPPRDPVNALLSLGYTLLLSRVVAACEAAGLEVALGGLHAYHPGRPSLACDLMEPLRVPAVDRWVVLSCNQGRVSLDDFVSTEEAGTRLKPERLPAILQGWEQHWVDQGLEGQLGVWMKESISWLRSNAPQLEPSDAAEDEDL
jgi:CRISPR-associated protein Cas1